MGGPKESGLYCIQMLYNFRYLDTIKLKIRLIYYY